MGGEVAQLAGDAGDALQTGGGGGQAEGAEQRGDAGVAGALAIVKGLDSRAASLGGQVVGLVGVDVGQLGVGGGGGAVQGVVLLQQAPVGWKGGQGGR